MKRGVLRALALIVVVAVAPNFLGERPATAAVGFSRLTQESFIFENDDEDQTSGDAVDENTQQGARNVALTGVKKGERLTARMQITNTGDAAIDPRNLGLFYDRNDGIWSKVRSQTPPVTGTGNCTSTNFDCTTVDGSGIVAGQYTSTAIDPSGNPWVSYLDSSNGDLKVARYMGSGGSGCASTAWSCSAVDTTGSVGQYTSMGFDAGGTGWISFVDNTNGAIKVAKFVGSGGTGCATAAWACTSVYSTASGVDWTSIAFDSSGNPWVSFREAALVRDLKVARYVGSGGTGCASVAWTCTTVDSTNEVGEYTSIAFDPAGDAWISYYDGTNSDLRVARYVGSGGTGCASTAWTCTAVDTSATYGLWTSIAFDPTGAPWISYYDSGNSDLRIARYLGSGGTGCASAAWTCTTADTAGGEYTSIAFDPSGSAWVSFRDAAGGLRRARYVGSGGTGCSSTAWTCAIVDSDSDAGYYTSLAFGPGGEAWIGYYNNSAQDLRVANLAFRGGEIVTSAGAAGKAGDPLNESHADMTSVSDASNRDDADCVTGGASWNNGKWFDSEEGSGVNLPAGNVTPQCTEVAFTIDTSQAVAGRTYRLLLSTNDGWRQDKGRWRGPVAVSSGAYPSLTIESSTTMRASKDSQLKMANCAAAGWGCSAIDTTGDVGRWTSLAFDRSGNPWISYRDNTNNDLLVAQYVVSGGTGCFSTAWKCTPVDTGGSVGNYTWIAFDHNDIPWVSYLDVTNNDLKVATFVGSGGSGCASTAWTCTKVETTNAVGNYSHIAFDASGNPWISYYDSTNLDLRVAQYVGSGGIGCASTAWTCMAVETTGDVGHYAMIAFDATGSPWVSYYDNTLKDLRVARYVGSGGTGCASAAWTCTTVETAGDIGHYAMIAFDVSGIGWISYLDNTNFDLKIARYVGSGGTGCASTAWTCSAVDSAGDVGYYSSIEFDSAGNPWISYIYNTTTDLKVARYVGSAGTGCASAAWTCAAVDTANAVGYFTTIAFDAAGNPWVTYFDNTNFDLRVAKPHLPSAKPSTDTKIAYPGRSAGDGDGLYRLDWGDPPRGSPPCNATPNNQGYCAIRADDGDYDSMAGKANERPDYVVASDFAINSSAPSATWVGQSNVAPSTRAVVMEVYRFGTTNNWEALSPYATDTCASAGASTDCTITDSPSGPAAEYFESIGSTYRAYFRIYQTEGATAETLSTDCFAQSCVGNTAPSNPGSLSQKKTDDTVIPTAGWINQTSVKFTASASDPDASDTLELCVEKKAIGTPFVNTEDACGTGVGYSGSPVTVSVTLSGLSDATEYHWQARVKDAAGAYSGWVSYGGNAETTRDFGIDTTAPTGGVVYDGTSTGFDMSVNDGSLSSLSANWSGFDASVSGLSKYEYSIGTSAGANDVKTWTDNGVATSVTATGLTLQTSKLYFFNVRATDNAENTGAAVSSNGQLVAPYLTFSVAPTSVGFASLSSANSFTDTKTSTLTTSTNGYAGYVVRAFAVDFLRSAGGSTIGSFSGGTYASPDSWQSGDTGFGYTSNDSDVQGANKFQSDPCPGGSALTAPGCYAPFTTAQPGEIVADHTGNVTGSPITDEAFVVTYRVTVTSLQPAGRYSTVIVYTNTATY
jgi:hypothetical protein